MAKYPAEKLLDFLVIVDEELGETSDVLIIGGAAIAIAYSGARYVTGDIDVLKASSKRFGAALQRALARAPEPVPISMTTIASEPPGYEERCVRIQDKRLKWIRLYVPEQHDLAMMKLARGDTTDIDALVDIHDDHPFVLLTLIERYVEMLPTLVGVRPNDFRWAFLALVQRLLGDKGVAAAEAKLGKPSK